MAGSLIGSEIIKIGNEVNEMIKQGQEICNLTIGDFDPAIFPIPEDLATGITAAYQAHHTNYPPANGIAELRQAAHDFLKARLGLDYPTNDFLVAGGSRPLIYATYRALIDAGDRVVFPVPSWNNNHYCHLTGATPIMVPTRPENEFMPTAAEVAPHLARHQEVAALDLWTDDDALARSLEDLAAGTVKRTRRRSSVDFSDARLEGLGAIERFVELKTVWHPAGL